MCEEFEVLSRNTVVARVIVAGKNVCVTKENVPIAIQPFKRDPCTMTDIYNFLKDRCYEDGRYDLSDILHEAALTSNDPWAWNKLTHGVTADDFWWIRWKGETLTWEDVRWKR